MFFDGILKDVQPLLHDKLVAKYISYFGITIGFKLSLIP